MRALWATAGLALRRFVRDRANIFFAFVLPLLLVFVIGVQFGGGGPSGRVALTAASTEASAPGAGDADGGLTQAVAAGLSDAGLEVDALGRDTALQRVSRGRADVALLLPMAAADDYAAEQDVRLEMVVGSDGSSGDVAAQVRQVVAGVATARAQLTALTAAGHGVGDSAQALAAARSEDGAVTVSVVDTSDIAQAFAGTGGFTVGAGSQLLLFVFLNSLAASQDLIQSRRYGTITRALATPVPAGRVLGGQALGRFAIAFAQGAYIMAASSLLFSVGWGNLAASLVVLAAFAAVAAGAAMLLGALLDNEGAASAAGIGIGLVLAGLGGGMLPLELFPDTLRRIAHVTPHAWGYDAFAQIQRHGGGVLDVLPELGVLLGMAVLLLGVGAWALRRSATRAI